MRNSLLNQTEPWQSLQRVIKRLNTWSVCSLLHTAMLANSLLKIITWSSSHCTGSAGCSARYWDHRRVLVITYDTWVLIGLLIWKSTCVYMEKYMCWNQANCFKEKWYLDTPSLRHIPSSLGLANGWLMSASVPRDIYLLLFLDEQQASFSASSAEDQGSYIWEIWAQERFQSNCRGSPKPNTTKLVSGTGEPWLPSNFLCDSSSWL